jgi:hypothetical protein
MATPPPSSAPAAGADQRYDSRLRKNAAAATTMPLTAEANVVAKVNPIGTPGS